MSTVSDGLRTKGTLQHGLVVRYQFVKMFAKFTVRQMEGRRVSARCIQQTTVTFHSRGSPPKEGKYESKKTMIGDFEAISCFCMLSCLRLYVCPLFLYVCSSCMLDDLDLGGYDFQHVFCKVLPAPQLLCTHACTRRRTHPGEKGE